MRLAAALAIAVLVAGCSQGLPTPPEPGRIDGAVLDSLLQPLGSTTVTLVELGRTDVTNRLGGFTFQGVPPGNHTLHVPEHGTTQRIHVTAGATVRTILQLPPPVTVPPKVESFDQHVQTQLAMPGECSTCTWSQRLNPDADIVALEGTWFARGLSRTDAHVTVELWDGETLLGALEVPGTGVLTVTTLPGRLLPDDGEVEVRVRFPDGFVPEAQFSMDTRLRTYQ
ncbi:MAG TPA: carboxypeptidase-like regulatory domain-containing protein, partial [Candidatus Thermoplasmatota archaeon]|nr:carboxypeptidase-like regulatory domain-containing protein [Candidatus Thermoplasmatota archaeon]